MLAKFFVWKNLLFFEKLLANHPFDFEAKVELNVRLVQRAEFPEIIENFPNLSTIEVENRFKAGHLCFGAEIRGKLVHLRWVTLDEVCLWGFGRKIHVDSDSAYLYDAFTIPEYRGLGISPKVFDEVLKYLMINMNIERVCISILHTNFSSLRAAQKEGLQKFGAFKYFRILKFRLYRFEGESKKDLKKLKAMVRA